MVTAADRGREVRGRLLRAASELVGERGWAAVSTRMLAERAGVAPGLVHYHFASLQALLIEAAVGELRALLVELGPMLEGARTPDEGLGLVLGSLDQYSGHDPTSLLITETYLAATRDEDLRGAVAAVIAEFRARFAGWLDGHGVPQPDLTAAVLTAAVDGLLLHRTLSPDLTAATVAPVLRRMLTPADTRRASEDEAGEDA